MYTLQLCLRAIAHHHSNWETKKNDRLLLKHPGKLLLTVPKQIHRDEFDKKLMKVESTAVDLFRKE
jgi:hypothetical protein